MGLVSEIGAQQCVLFYIPHVFSSLFDFLCFPLVNQIRGHTLYQALLASPRYGSFVAFVHHDKTVRVALSFLVDCRQTDVPGK